MPTSGAEVCTSKYVRLIHVVCAEDGDSAGPAALQQGPDLVPGAGVHACCGLVQEQDLKDKPSQTDMRFLICYK